jgi:hypothetical protein
MARRIGVRLAMLAGRVAVLHHGSSTAPDDATRGTAAGDGGGAAELGGASTMGRAARSSVAGRGVGSKTAGSWACIIAHPTAIAQPAKGSNNIILILSSRSREPAHRYASCSRDGLITGTETALNSIFRGSPAGVSMGFAVFCGLPALTLSYSISSNFGVLRVSRVVPRMRNRGRGAMCDYPQTGEPTAAL